MPLYEYQCAQCGRFELIQKFADPPLAVCPTCGQEVQKLLSSPAIQFKGSGWYITDYARKGGGGEGKEANKDSSSKPADSSAKPADSSSSSPQSSTSKDSSAPGSSSTK